MSFEVSRIMINKKQPIDKQEFIQHLFGAVSSIDEDESSLGDSGVSGVKDVATNQAIDPLINPLLQQQVINTEHDPVFPSMSILLKQQLLEQDLTLSADFFKLVKLIDKLFDNLLIDKYLKKGIKNLISQIRIPFFKLALNDKTLLTETSHPARLLLNDISKVGLLWSAQDPKTSQIKEQLEVIIQQIISTSKEQDINKVFSCAEEQFRQFSSGLVKRVEIFEKRLRESEEGKARAESTQAAAKKLLSKVTCKKDIPLFVLNIFNKAWERVIFLELLKENDGKKGNDETKVNDEEQSEALFTAKQLLVSLQPISDEEELENHKTLQSQLIDRLKRGLLKVAYPYSEADIFFEQLNDQYEAILAQAKITIKEKESQKIIRLKPIDIFDDKHSDDVIEENQSESGARATSTSMAEKKLNQWVDNVFSELPVDAQNLTTINDESIEKKTTANLETLTDLQKSPWFELMVEQHNIRVRFSSYIQLIDKYVFVDGAGTKIAEFNSSELNQLFRDKKIVALDPSPAFDKAYRLVVDEFISAHLKAEQERLEIEQREAQKIKEEQRKAEEIETIKKKLDQAEQLVKEEKDKREKEKKEKEAALKKADLELREKQPAIEISQLTEGERNHILENIANLALGTRVELELKGEIKWCRLAAKIASTGMFVFADQNGNKVMQCTEQELVEMFESGQLKLRQKTGLFDEALTTIISSMRSLKSDKNS
ncbi:DUF1631 family protein [Aliikangiella coralliicola]|uniref:DUF1631 domain-containing protein n=1 Tax=Aliikangiella coralliicola TaxID=2592383 RepID=A0A545UDN9_9GAMM|nr:DUF1631 family protein [Aliikangiella coralliicola]TQV87582.1 DUF1631 domain-containing protein [Aliikangiella coralliicola]